MNVEKYLEKCEICPHKCKVNRLNGNIGRCKATDKTAMAADMITKVIKT